MNPSDNTAELVALMGKELTRKRVLLVDRHQNARNSLRLMLSALGITSVHGANNSAEVIRQVKANHFDIILSDYILDDGRDGQQLLEELRQQRLISLATVFIVITSERGYHNVVSVAELAPDDYLIKPFTPDELLGRLVKAIYKKLYFGRVFEHLDNGTYVDALAACEVLVGQGGAFLYDALRFKGEILNALGRHHEAQQVYQKVLENRMVPWGRMGLAIALRGQQQLAEAEVMGQALIDEFPEFMAAYDFVAEIREEMGKLDEAQAALVQAATISPNNTSRQRMVGDVAARNNDLETAERAYGKVLERHRGSSLRTVDDYTNLSRVMLDRGHTTAARLIARELRRDWRGSKQGELAALVTESLCAKQEGEDAKAQQALESALALHDAMEKDAHGASGKLFVDLAHACLATGNDVRGQEILRKVAAENHENRNMIAQIQGVFVRTGNENAGQDLLAQVGREIVELNNRGVLAARSGDVEGSVKMLMEAAERVPNLQFLVNASKAIFTLLERRGWDSDLAESGLRYLNQAQAKDPGNSKVISARELHHRVARKFGIAIDSNRSTV